MFYSAALSWVDLSVGRSSLSPSCHCSLSSKQHNISFQHVESGYHGLVTWPVSLTSLTSLLCSSSCCVRVCCSWHSFWCPATWRAPSPPLRDVMGSPVRSQGCWRPLMRWAGEVSRVQGLWHASIFTVTLLASCPGRKHCPHRLCKLLWESSPPTTVHWRRSSVGLPRLPADGFAAFPEWTVRVHRPNQLWEKTHT